MTRSVSQPNIEPNAPHIPSHLRAFFARLDEHDDVVPPEILERELNALRLTPNDLRDFIRFGPDHYQRNRIHIGRAYHALALCWGKGQHSPIHNHKGSGCGVHVVQGSAVETTYDRDDNGVLHIRDHHDYKPGDVYVSVDSDIHTMGNESSDEGLVTMHIYSPPLLRCEKFSLDSTEVGEWRDAEFDG